MLIAEQTKLRPYLDFILDKEIVTQVARQNVLMVKQVLNKNPIDTTHNAISVLNSLTEEEIRKATIHDRVFVITWEKRVVNKYQHLETVQAKIDVMHRQIKEFIELFNPLFKRGLPFFWEEKAGIIGGSLAGQYYIMSIHIGGLNTPKILKNIFPCIKG